MSQDEDAYRFRVTSAADVAGLGGATRIQFTNIAASWAMSGMPLLDDELRTGAEVLAGRLDVDDYLSQLGLRPANPSAG